MDVSFFLKGLIMGFSIAAPVGPIGHYVSTFVLTLTNPMTILAFAAIFAGLGMAL